MTPSSEKIVEAGARAAWPKFWSDDFDMDLLRVLPDAEAIIGDLASIEIETTGHLMHGRLNHPTVWNGDTGMLAFFRHRGSQRPSVYWTDSPPVRCFVIEALRDAWVHSYQMIVDDQLIWDTGMLWRDFEAIMWHRRGWGDDTKARARRSAAAVKKVRRSLIVAVARLSEIMDGLK